MNKEYLRKVFSEYAAIANDQMKALNAFYESNKEYLKYWHFGFVPEERFELDSFSFDSGGYLYAQFTIYNYENSQCFELDMGKGFESAMKAMEDKLSFAKQREQKQIEEHRAARLRQYQNLKLEFEGK